MVAVRSGLAVALLALAAAAQVDLAITSPADGTSVAERPVIQGTVKNAKTPVWVIVHPLETSDYWVQPRVTVRDSGAWKVQVYVGRSGTVDVGKRFEIRAVGNPKPRLREGMTLDGWPDSGALSNVIEVTRR